MHTFDYTEAFSRNLGWISEYEQLKLKSSRIAIAGMGGVGGIYLLTCVRMGIENFSLSEFDTFELGNFNRQVGSSMATVGRPKLEVMIEQARQINPNVNIRSFPEGINANNVEAFLKDCDVYLDGIDLFETGVRRLIYKECQKKGIPGISCVPVAMGYAQLVFADKSPDFDEFYDFNSYPKECESLLLVVGMTPKGLHRSYLHDPSRIHFADRKVSSSFMGCQLCAGAAVTEAMKYILDRGHKVQAPYGLHYDAHENKFRTSVLFWGNKGPLQRLKIKIAMNQILSKNKFPYPYHPAYKDSELLPPLQGVVDLARWAPIPHNEQLCQVHVTSSTSLVISLKKANLYADESDILRFTYMSFGLYFESMRQAASLKGWECHWEKTDNPLEFKITFTENPLLAPEETGAYIRARFTDRRSYKTTPIPHDMLQDLLAHTIDDDYKLLYEGTFKEKLAFARMEMTSFATELTDQPTARLVADAMDFENPYSPDKVPFESAGLSFPNNILGKMIMPKRNLMAFLNKIKGDLGVILDYAFMPHVRCAGHFYLVRKSPTTNENETETWIKDGQMVQRLWLKATLHGLTLQPSIFQIIIARNQYYLKNEDKTVRKNAEQLKVFLTAKTKEDLGQTVFLGRLGFPLDRKVYSRSTRIEG